MNCILVYLDYPEQSYLLLTEVPEVISVSNTNYHLQYSPSYTGTIGGSCDVEDFSHCMPLENAIQALLRQNYNSFLLTILSTTVAIYCISDGKFKIFDSHARDLHLACLILRELVYC